MRKKALLFLFVDMLFRNVFLFCLDGIFISIASKSFINETVSL